MRSAFIEWACQYWCCKPDSWRLKTNMDGSFSESNVQAAWSAWKFLRNNMKEE